MELQVQDLLERIKSEGVDAARVEADRIIAEAGTRAAAIVGGAEKRAEELESGAKTRIEAMEKASRLALTQASRDTILALRGKVQKFMRDAVLSSTSEVMNASFVATLLPGLLSLMAKETKSDLAVLLPPQTLKELDGALANRLSKEIGVGIQFRPFDGIDAGFRISADASGAQYDFSAQSVADILASRVNARLAECVEASLANNPLADGPQAEGSHS